MNKTYETPRGRDNGTEQAGSLSSKSHEVAEHARQVAMERVDSVRQSTESAKQQAADKIRKFGATIRKVGEHLRVEDQSFIAQKAAAAPIVQKGAAWVPELRSEHDADPASVQ